MFKQKLLSLAFVGLGLVAAASQAADYVIDTKSAHASVNFGVSHLGYGMVIGRFDKFTGEFSYDAAKPEASSVEVTIDTSSVNSNFSERDKHLRGANFLDVEKFPEASFVSKQVVPGSVEKGQFALLGDLTLHGVTKPVTIKVKKIGEGKDPWGGYRAGFQGEAEINMRDFNIVMDLGPASQTVKLELYVEGIKK